MGKMMEVVITCKLFFQIKGLKGVRGKAEKVSENQILNIDISQ